jgi:activator of HSP90 ATPase
LIIFCFGGLIPSLTRVQKLFSATSFSEEFVNTFDNSLAPTLPSTRRQWLSGLAVTAGAFALACESRADSANGLSHTAEAIHQEIVFKAAPQRIYAALTDAQQFQKVELLSGAMKDTDLNAKPAKISIEPGGAFSIFGDYIIGRQLELVPGQRIVQAWREISWDPGIFSIARFELKAQNAGTKLIFDHTGFPAGNGEHLAIGWNAHYWKPLEKYLT